MKKIVQTLSELSGEEKRKFMEVASFRVRNILVESKEEIKESIANSILSILELQEEKKYLESIIVIKPGGAKELLGSILVFELIMHLCHKLNISIQEIKEVVISPEMIDIIYHRNTVDKHNNAIYKDLCNYFSSGVSTIIKVEGENINEKINLIKLHIRLLYVAKNQGKYDFIKNILHSPDVNEIIDNFRAFGYIK